MYLSSYYALTKFLLYSFIAMPICYPCAMLIIIQNRYASSMLGFIIIAHSKQYRGTSNTSATSLTLALFLQLALCNKKHFRESSTS